MTPASAGSRTGASSSAMNCNGIQKSSEHHVRAAEQTWCIFAHLTVEHCLQFRTQLTTEAHTAPSE